MFKLFQNERIYDTHDAIRQYDNDSEMTSSSSKRGILLHQSGSGDAEGKTPVCEISRSTLTTIDSSAPLCYVVNSTATLTLTDVTLNVASSHLMSVPTDSKGSGSTGTLVLKTTKDSWTYQGTVSAGSDNKVAVEVGQGVTRQLTADTNVNTLVNNGTIVTNGYTLNVSGSSSGTGTISETTGISSMMTPLIHTGINENWQRLLLSAASLFVSKCVSLSERDRTVAHA